MDHSANSFYAHSCASTLKLDEDGTTCIHIRIYNQADTSCWPGKKQGAKSRKWQKVTKSQTSGVGDYEFRDLMDSNMYHKD